MKPISLTSFVDFVVARSATAKVTKVRRTIEMYKAKYDPAKDYWKPLRKEIINLHKNGRPKGDLDNILGTIDSKKLDNYRDRIFKYQKWVGRKKIAWLDEPPWQQVTVGSITVNVNPELYVSVNDKPKLIKIHFKDPSESISKRQVETILYLLAGLIPSDDNVSVGLLHLMDGKLVEAEAPDPDIFLGLEAEAASFAHLWKKLDGP